ncbi:MAG: hypothetical protein R3E21_10900 [Caenibius sp.]
MLPSIELRIANLVKAVQQVILPALPTDRRLAQEQARLIVGHLGLISEQWKYALRFELGSLNNMMELARDLSPVVEPTQTVVLEEALAAVANIDRADIDAIQSAIVVVGNAVDVVIYGDEGRIPLSDAANNVILAYGRRQSLRERTWFKGNGQDPHLTTLPDIAEVL